MNNEMTLERQHYLISPSDPTQRVVTEKIEQASRNKLISDYKIRLNPGYMTTIACVYTEALIRTLVAIMRENRGQGAINFLDLFTISSSNRENDDADKDGNINIKFVPGSTCTSIMEREFAPVVEEPMWKDTILERVQKECGSILLNKHKMTGNNVNLWTKVTYVYMEYLFRTLRLMVKVGLENGHNATSINFLEMFEAHALIEQVSNPENPDLVSEEITVKLRPGFQAKLLIKDDGITEKFDEDEE